MDAAVDPPPETMALLSDLFAQARYIELLAITERLLSHFNRSSNLYFIQGRARAALNRHHEALPCYQKAVSLAPEHAEAWCGLGSAQLTVKRPEAARDAFRQTLTLDPRHGDALSGLGMALFELQEFEDAERCFEAVCQSQPDNARAQTNLARLLRRRGDLQAAAARFTRALELEPGSAEAHNDLGLILLENGDTDQAAGHFNSALRLQPDYTTARHNLGLARYRSGDLDTAAACFRDVLASAPDSPVTLNELGNVLADSGDIPAARACFDRAIAQEPGFVDALWNLAGAAPGVAHACEILQRYLAVEPDNEAAAMMLAGLKSTRNGRDELRPFAGSACEQHPFLRSFRWVLELPSPPEVCFDRWSFFDLAMSHCEQGRPFYEFGVWRGRSFSYLVESLGQGFGFDSFEGLPEDWHEQSAGSYSSRGAVPSIPGGEFVVGRFEDTLPRFFAVERPVASLVHLDADLYGSTLCALTHARPVIDARTVLVFDELLMNDAWEQDEYRALEEFCGDHGWTYEVIAVSFFTKQVALRLNC
ncbi:MAG: tetratricopeptide repeat protein [Pseudomonadota bacterium]